MKIKIGNGTLIDCMMVSVDGPVLKAFGLRPGIKMKPGDNIPLILAYHLHPGETVRANFINGEEVYEVNQ